MTQKAYVEIMKAAALSLAKSKVMAYIVSTAIPGLAGSIFLGPVSWAVTKILTIAIMHTEFGLFFLYVDCRSSKEGQEFFEAAVKNHQLLESGTDEEKKNAEKELVDRFRVFAKFTSN